MHSDLASLYESHYFSQRHAIAALSVSQDRLLWPHLSAYTTIPPSAGDTFPGTVGDEQGTTKHHAIAALSVSHWEICLGKTDYSGHVFLLTQPSRLLPGTHFWGQLEKNKEQPNHYIVAKGRLDV